MSREGGNIWYPYTQMKTSGAPIRIVRGEGAYLYDDAGNQYIDAISSWWTNIHGHAHPHIAERIAAQAKTLEHVIFSGFTHEPAERLADKLLEYIPYHSKVFYTDNGSTAVEVAVKMALQYWSNEGQQRNKLIALRDAYHGDTFGSMSISARGVFTQPYQPLLFEVEFLDTPDYSNRHHVISQLNQIIQLNHQQIAALIFEPLVLGSAGMLMYSSEILDEIISICKHNNILAIADEVMTGFGRTGKFLATDYCTHKPDIICLSKGITGGFLPFAATTCTGEIFDAFYSDDKHKMLFHGHSYSGNPLGCAAGVAGLELFEMEKTMERVAHISDKHSRFASSIRNHPGILEVRQQGTILAMEIQTNASTSYMNPIRDRAYSYFINRKILLRPLGNVIYVLPPYCIKDEDLDRIYIAIGDFVGAIEV